MKKKKRNIFCIILGVFILSCSFIFVSRTNGAVSHGFSIQFHAPNDYENTLPNLPIHYLTGTDYGYDGSIIYPYSETTPVSTLADVYLAYRGQKELDSSWERKWNNKEKTGYIFAWNAQSLERSTNTIAYYGEPMKEVLTRLGYSGDLTDAYSDIYYFEWIETPILYTIHYNGNGATSGSMTNTTHTYDDPKALTLNGFEKAGYHFQGWSTNTDAAAITYTNGQTVSNLTTTHNDVIELYAVWEPNDYTIIFSENGGTPITSTKIVTYDQTYGTLPTPTRTGYTFQGWYTAASGGTQITTDTKVSITQNQTLYAHWEANPYKVTYHPNGGSTSATSNTCIYGTAIPLDPVATKNGYTFAGWATSPNASKPLTSLTMPDLATSSDPDYSSDWELTLYALYSIDVSDVSNHTYPSYDKIKQDEVSLIVWKENDPFSYKTYELTYMGDVGIMHYEYQLTKTDFSSYVGNEAYGYKILAYDNAGNYSVLYQNTSTGKDIPEPVIPEKYLQTVNHYTYDTSLEKWIYYDSTSQLMDEGQVFTPSYITPPTGYKTDHIDSHYTVTSKRTSNAYYVPLTYTLTFDPNGGTVSPSSKNIIYNDYYGEMPIPTKTGHSFIGWYTDTNGENQVIDSMQYTIPDDSTVYALWQENSYHVQYDYWTNGGTAASKTTDSIAYGSDVDISVHAEKEGWTFVGWNTDPDAFTGLSAIQMQDNDLILYAIYKKDISVTFVDGLDSFIQTISKTIYNRETSCSISIPALKNIDGWKALGWSLNEEADGDIHASVGNTYTLSDSTTFYGCYIQDITISYDTSGSAEKIPSQTKERFYNASGNYKNPSFTLASAPKLDKHSFVTWEEVDSDGTVSRNYTEKQELEVNRNLYLTAKWDSYPEIEAYDRYFTLEDVLNGVITDEELFEKVTSKDKEDGTLINGKDVTIPNLSQYDFLHNPDVVITYEAKDSFGNIVEKSITIHVVDTTVIESPIIFYSRFISLDFYADHEKLISEEYGGLKTTSVWRTSEIHKQLLEHTLNDTEPMESWNFSKLEIDNLKETLYTN